MQAADADAPQSPFSILLLEDSAIDADLVREHLILAGIPHRLDRVIDRDEFVGALGGRTYDAILADHALPSFDGMAALAIAREMAPETPFIFVSGTLGEEVAIDSLKLGATDYVVKQRLQRLPVALRRALAETRERAERRKAEEHQSLLLAELSHRVKNTLATVVSIAQQTLRRSGSLAEFEAGFMGRMRALADAHTLLLHGNWLKADLRAVVAQALRPFQCAPGAGAATAVAEFDGPDALLEPRAAMTLTLVLHELATNAAKHGALKAPEGRVSVRWNIAPLAGGRRSLRLVWTERDGPPVRPPSRDGFGSTLIRQSVRYELDGTAELSFPETGVVCELSFPLAEPPDSAPRRPVPGAAPQAAMTASSVPARDGTVAAANSLDAVTTRR